MLHRSAVLFFSALLACGPAGEVGSQDGNAVDAGSLKRLFGALTDKLRNLGDEAPLLGDDSGGTATPTFVPIDSVDALAYDGALIGARPGDPMAEQGCVFLTKPGEPLSAAALEGALQHTVRLYDPTDFEFPLTFYVNGIATSAEAHCATLRAIAEFGNTEGVRVIGIYNATQGFAKDVWQTGWDRFSIGVERVFTEFGLGRLSEMHENTAADTLVNAILYRVRSGEGIYIKAHSQGGAITSLALHRAARILADEGVWKRNEDGSYLVDHISVSTYGSAAPAWPNMLARNDEGEVYHPIDHNVHVRDATPALLGISLWNWKEDGEGRTGGGFVQFMDSNEDGSYWGYVEEVHRDTLEVDFLDLHPTRFHGVEQYTRLIWGQ
jgi:hypothetical protein